MAKNDHAHAIRMAESLKRRVNEAAAADFVARLALSKSAGIEKKYEWAKTACLYLEERFDENTIQELRKECSCSDGKSAAKRMKGYLRRAGRMREFVAVFNRSESFAQMEYLSENSLLFCYPECYCACIKRVPGEISKSWCYCTLGNAEGIFREVFQKQVRASLVKSIKSGADRCVISIGWQ
ncbi:MAG: hypothetical protein HFG27_07355 [Provencibacterium sp.]|jgi:hypothetical protein|nr:hypothetical protein [Provencibacterium sp.]